MTDKVKKKFLIQYRDSESETFKEMMYLVLDLDALEDLGPDFIYQQLVKEHSVDNVRITELSVSEIDNEIVTELKTNQEK